MDTTNQTYNGVPIEDILTPFADNPDLVERIAHRKIKPPLEIVAADPQWPLHFQTFQSRILGAFDDQEDDKVQSKSSAILSINHVGSTSVPDLPAKPVIDIDLVLSDHTHEPPYIPRLEAAGFRFLLREPAWHGHRFLVADEPMSCNLHVWGPGCPEVERHKIFRDYLLGCEEDRKLYARTKEACARVSRERGEVVDEYNLRKQEVLREILGRAFEWVGLVVKK